MTSAVAKPFRLRTPARWLVAEFGEPWNLASWAIVNGGFQRAASVSWLFVRPNEIAGVEDIQAWTQAKLHAEALAGSVAFLTSRREHAWHETEASESGTTCWAVGTIGLSNALRVGDPVGELMPLGTINLLLCVSQPLSTGAALELISLAGEAKSAAVLDSGLTSRRSGLPATGTGTDYLAVAWPNNGAVREEYAGKHTALGSATGRATYSVVAEGVAAWKKEFLAQP